MSIAQINIHIESMWVCILRFNFKEDFTISKFLWQLLNYEFEGIDQPGTLRS